MGTLAFIPRLQQLTGFAEMLRSGAKMDRRSLFQLVTDLSNQEVDNLLYNGLCSLQSPAEVWENAMAAEKSLGLESFVRDTIVDLQSYYSSGGDLAVELYPMDANDQFGRQKLGGVSAWTSWEGTTIHLVVYPAPETIPRLKSTVVHEYHHHYRTLALNNGHDRIPLLEILIREGMAEHFVAEVLGDSARGPYAAVLSRSEAQSLWQNTYRDRLFSSGDDHVNPYIFGGGASSLPLWAGYSMGYHLVDWYWDLHPDLSVKDLTRLDAECFVPTTEQI